MFIADVEIEFSTREQPSFNRQFDLLIKDLKNWESKKFHHEKTYSGVKGIGCGAGTQIVYWAADLIFVDTVANKLYVGLSTKGQLFSAKK